MSVFSQVHTGKQLGVEANSVPEALERKQEEKWSFLGMVTRHKISMCFFLN